MSDENEHTRARTEYLIILAVVLIIAVIVVFVMQFQPQAPQINQTNQTGVIPTTLKHSATCINEDGVVCYNIGDVGIYNSYSCIKDAELFAKYCSCGNSTTCTVGD